MHKHTFTAYSMIIYPTLCFFIDCENYEFVDHKPLKLVGRVPMGIACTKGYRHLYYVSLVPRPIVGVAWGQGYLYVSE